MQAGTKLFSTVRSQLKLKNISPRLLVAAIVVCICTLGGLALYPQESIAQSTQPDSVASTNDFQLYTPYQHYQPQLSTRLGFGMAAPRDLSVYPESSSLRAGWYHDWTVQTSPSTPDGITYVQTVRIHQDLECEIGTDYDRQRCPYAVPHSYTVRSGMFSISQAAQRTPGKLWIIGNEMDRVDWGRPGFGTTGHQDEMLPELYAEAYHDLYHYIKSHDPRARIAIGGIVQPTPLRLEYLTKVWDTYLEKYGTEMPVDVWNTHNFILREGRNGDWGAGVPPGSSASVGAFVGWRDDVGDRSYHVNMEIFDEQIRAFRAWMKERGQQDKPLIVTEYGVLYNNHAIFPNSGLYANNDPQPTVDFMLDTFDYFLHERDCELGYVADDCRLVQAWTWYVFNSNVANRHGRLFEANSGAITPAGEAFREYSLRNIDALSEPFPMP